MLTAEWSLAAQIKQEQGSRDIYRRDPHIRLHQHSLAPNRTHAVTSLSPSGVCQNQINHLLLIRTQDPSVFHWSACLEACFQHKNNIQILWKKNSELQNIKNTFCKSELMSYYYFPQSWHKKLQLPLNYILDVNSEFSHIKKAIIAFSSPFQEKK